MENKIKGSLYGLIWGDALGCPVETWKENEIKNVYGEYNDLPKSYPIQKIGVVNDKYIKRLRPIGLHSDDGQQAMALINICLVNNGWNKTAWANMLKDGMKRGAWRGTGRYFDDAVKKLSQGIMPERAGSASSGIGSAMRIGPLGAFFYDDLKELKQVVVESCATTHADLASISYSYAVTYVVSQLINNKTEKEIKDSLADAVLELENEVISGYKNWSIDRSKQNVVSESIRTIFSMDWKDLNAVRNKISEVAKPHLAEGFSKAHPNQGFVLTGGMHALVMGLQSNLGANQALLEIVKMGYDTDTVAAIAGSILGARFGFDWIPLDRFYDKDRILKYGEYLFKRDASPENSASFVSREFMLTKAEKDFQRSKK